MMGKYEQYICRGAHCKCMNLDGKCSGYHNGDHTCPSSTKQYIQMNTKEPPLRNIITQSKKEAEKSYIIQPSHSKPLSNKKEK